MDAADSATSQPILSLLFSTADFSNPENIFLKQSIPGGDVYSMLKPRTKTKTEEIVGILSRYFHETPDQILLGDSKLEGWWVKLMKSWDQISTIPPRTLQKAWKKTKH